MIGHEANNAQPLNKAQCSLSFAASYWSKLYVMQRRKKEIPPEKVERYLDLFNICVDRNNCDKGGDRPLPLTQPNVKVRIKFSLIETIERLPSPKFSRSQNMDYALLSL